MSDVIKNPSPADATPDRRAACPRCGYDLRGVVGAWDGGPPTGTCSECGLKFDWIDVLDPARRPPRWCVEYAEGWHRVPFSIARTLWATLQPWRFWRTLKMTHATRPWRMVAYLASLAIGLYLVFVFSMALASTRCWPFNFAGSYTSSVPEHQVALTTALKPFSRRTLGRANPAPRLLATGALPMAGASPQDALINGFLDHRQLRLSLAFALTFFAACPLGFVALPHTRKRAKVRWGHIARIFAYSLGGAAIIVALILWSGQDRLKVQVGGSPWLAGRIIEVTVVFTSLFLSTWWYMASSRYLRMPRAWIPITAVIVMAFLGASVAFVLHLVIGIPYWGLP